MHFFEDPATNIHNPPPFEFHVSRQARDRYRFDQSIFSLSGNVIFANFHAARQFAQKINSQKDLLHHPEQAVRAGQINAMGLIDEILHYVVGLYRRQRLAAAMQTALSYLEDRLGEKAVRQTLHQFAAEFPPLAVYRGEISLESYLSASTQVSPGETVPNTSLVLEELLMLWLANANLAFAPFGELFDDASLKLSTRYLELIDNLRLFFDAQPSFGPDEQNLIDMLRSPALAAPHSLSGQLEYIRSRWGYLLGEYLFRLLSSLDFIKEEEKAIFLGAGPSRVYDFTGLELEAERFSPDKDWMPNLVLIAKNVYVWLDQLSRKYQRLISHLDEIPDPELDTLARWGFTGLWLIGLWERSPASKRIKQMRGNPEAEASAYSLFDYLIAKDLGGEPAFLDLRRRAWQRGIRMSSDMVPNHMGIDSRWVIEHPDWFIALDHSPFPSYSFNGPNLSWDERVGLFLEDHYYDNSDAAVVFKRVDFWSGEEKFVYHGNDGTSMPWNDTAQLNFLNPEVREAVIQTILHVARKFPVIRFDAAMTLAKRHYQRLWFPEPGTGGDIPSRAGFGLTKEQFNAAFPNEFWREVVDRIAQEIPDTLLLAEAFWLMEGYFVRTLGMHRVYNSAFMNMLRDEKNQEYRLVIKNTLEFDPEILKRYVNFMNNPDERTAIDQFGKDDKYFGVCTLLATMPGLPMFGHGQIEGFTEKYGMEYRRSYWNEQPDLHLIERHEREIFPLLRRRYLFAEAHNFLLYDFFTPAGHVNEDVFAYSNQAGDERALVVYHNRFASTRGWIRQSAAYAKKSGEGRTLVQKTLADALGLSDQAGYFTIFRDQVTTLEYLRLSQDIHANGLYVELEAYKYHVFLDFRQIQDTAEGQYARLAAYLGGKGVPSVQEALQEMLLGPLLRAFGELVNPGHFLWITQNRMQVDESQVSGENLPPDNLESILEDVESRLDDLFEEIKKCTGANQDESEIVKEILLRLQALMRLPSLLSSTSPTLPPKLRKALAYLDRDGLIRDGDQRIWGILLSWLFTQDLGKIVSAGDADWLSRAWVDELLLGKVITATLASLAESQAGAQRDVRLVKILISQSSLWQNFTEKETKSRAGAILQAWLADGEALGFIGANRYEGVLYFNRESFEELLWWAYTFAAVQACAKNSEDPEDLWESLGSCHAIVQHILRLEKRSGYQVEKLH